MNRSQGTNETQTFQLYKADVAAQAEMPVHLMDRGVLFKAYDNGEPAWMAADTVKLFAGIRGRFEDQVKPYALPKLSAVCVLRVIVNE